jgi:REase_AHJR-like
VMEARTEAGARRLREVAEEYRGRGYEVLLEPKRKHLPRALARFHPDLVARKGDELVVVEVKSRSTLRQDPQLGELARAVRAHPGWRFELIIANPEHDGLVPEGAQAWEERDVLERLDEARSLLNAGHLEAALLLAWSAAEAALRLLAEADEVASSRQDAAYLLKQLAFTAALTREQFQFLQNMFELRNAFAHGHTPAGFALIAPPEIGALIDLTGLLLREANEAADVG